MARLALSTRGKRKFACANWCQDSLHCQLRITATITRGIQAVLCGEWQYTALSFSTQGMVCEVEVYEGCVGMGCEGVGY